MQVVGGCGPLKFKYIAVQQEREQRQRGRDGLEQHMQAHHEPGIKQHASLPPAIRASESRCFWTAADDCAYLACTIVASLRLHIPQA